MNFIQKHFKHDKHDKHSEHDGSSHSGHEQPAPSKPAYSDNGPAKRISSWPPKVHSIDIVGEVQDTRGNKCPRDIGRSFKFGEHWYYAFGDSYHFDKKGDFCGCSNNTVAHIPDLSKPCESTYMCKDTFVPAFIPLTKAEKEFTEKHKGENWRKVTWPFGGVVEDEPGSGKGWIWFDVAETHGGQDAGNDGVRVARMTLDGGCQIKVERTTPDERIFPKEWPQFGHRSVVKHEDYVYCIGGKTEGLANSNYLARVKHGSDPSKGSNYEFWTKDGWKKDFDNIDALESIFGEFSQGEIVPMPGRGPDGANLMMIGCNIFGDGTVYMGFAHQMTGPWAISELGKVPGYFKEDAMRYAIFPHTWAYNWNDGELLITFSDSGQMGGAVIAAKVKFEVADAS